MTIQGSSPLARGTHGVCDCVDVCGGLIPARAGNTVDDALVVVDDRAHPRSRGEHTC